eukprot:2938329-Rhodomonas_salina.2
MSSIPGNALVTMHAPLAVARSRRSERYSAIPGGLRETASTTLARASTSDASSAHSSPRLLKLSARHGFSGP